ncbi:AAA family ATPase [Candidatus Woesearchaeota archaeon]|nr:AAA family ATPase [Candidatus Woesearchaeota archaeon]
MKSKLKFRAHVKILQFIEELDYGCGKNLLCDVLTGKKTKQIKRLNLDKKILHGSLALYDKKDVMGLINLLLHKKYIRYQRPKGKYFKILKLTEKGKKELNEPHDTEDLKSSINNSFKIEKITEEDKKIFCKLGACLEDISDEQKKAVIEKNSRILCIAGAGSGKTTVLTKRIWFLTNFRNVPQEKILAITFTRKARKQMRYQLEKLIPGNRINVETFNSFSEKVLRKHKDLIYDKEFKVLGFKEKKNLLFQILKEKDYSAEDAIDLYFSEKKVSKDDEVSLFLRFMYDIFSVLDYQRNNRMTQDQLIRDLHAYKNKRLGKFLAEVISKIEFYKQKLGYRDFTDQIVHTLEFFNNNKEMIPDFSHILVDEYQDVNDMQIELIDTLSPDNLFVVGDPRQSIYGWRGSRISHILGFSKKYDNGCILQLTKNFRSDDHIVDVINAVISPMKLPDLNAHKDKNKDSVVLVEHDSEKTEMEFVVQSILAQEIKRKEIFILARTNSQLDKIEPMLRKAKIGYVKKTTGFSLRKSRPPKDDEITMSTIHAIKGLEAEIVYVLGATTKYFPCIASDHPVMEMLKLNNSYDKFDEELRVFYVALSRAKSKLIINNHGSKSIFFTKKALKLIKKKIDLTQQIKWKYSKKKKFNDDKGYEKYFVY